MARPSPVDRMCGTLAAATDASYDDPSFSRAAYDTVAHVALSNTLPDACPPLPFVIHAIHDILFPSFLLNQIPNLLRLLAHLEAARHHLSRTIHLVLQPDHPFAVLLQDADRDHLASISTPSRIASHRKIYRQLVHALSLLHIQHLWRVYDPNTHDPLTDTLVAYFPALIFRENDLLDESRESLKTHPWNNGLTKDELADNHAAGQRAVKFICDASHYVDDPVAYCNEHEFELNTSFDDVFSPPDSTQVLPTIIRFIKVVKHSADALGALTR